MLRLQYWKEILEEHDEVADLMKENIKKSFFLNIKYKISSEKRRYMHKIK